MTAQEARSIRSPLIEFGSQAMTYLSLPTLSSADKGREIAESVSACEALTGARPLTFAYPFGDFDPESQALVRESQFRTCVHGAGSCDCPRRPALRPSTSAGRKLERAQATKRAQLPRVERRLSASEAESWRMRLASTWWIRSEMAPSSLPGASIGSAVPAS